MEAAMNATLTCPRQRTTSTDPAMRPSTERVLRDMAFVLKLTQRVSDEIRSAAAGISPRPR
jgi:hypothetical protein